MQSHVTHTRKETEKASRARCLALDQKQPLAGGVEGHAGEAGEHAAAEQAGFPRKEGPRVQADLTPLRRSPPSCTSAQMLFAPPGERPIVVRPSCPAAAGEATHCSAVLQPVSTRVHSGGLPPTATRAQNTPLRLASGTAVPAVRTSERASRRTFCAA